MRERVHAISAFNGGFQRRGRHPHAQVCRGAEAWLGGDGDAEGKKLAWRERVRRNKESLAVFRARGHSQGRGVGQEGPLVVKRSDVGARAQRNINHLKQQGTRCRRHSHAQQRHRLREKREKWNTPPRNSPRRARADRHHLRRTRWGARRRTW